MSLATAILTGDVAELPSRRDEDWRWTDLRGLIRTLPAASEAYAGEIAKGPFEAAEELLVINGHGPSHLRVGAGEHRTVALRFISHTAETALLARVTVEVAPGASLLVARVLDTDGGGRTDDVIAAVDWCHSQGARIASLSLGAR